MKKYVLLLLFMLLLTLCKAQDSWEEFGLKGQVKELSEKRYCAEYVNRQWIFTIYTRFYWVYKFDSNGYLASADECSSSLQWPEHTVTMVRNGNKTEATRHYKGKVPVDKTLTTHMDDGEVLAEKYNNEGQKLYHTTSKSQWTDSIKQTYIYSYSVNGVKDEAIVSECYNSYNAAGWRKVSFNGKLVLSERYSYSKFDEHGNWTECIVFNTSQLNNIDPRYVIRRELTYYK